MTLPAITLHELVHVTHSHAGRVVADAQIEVDRAFEVGLVDLAVQDLENRGVEVRLIPAQAALGATEALFYLILVQDEGADAEGVDARYVSQGGEDIMLKMELVLDRNIDDEWYLALEEGLLFLEHPGLTRLIPAEDLEGRSQ